MSYRALYRVWRPQHFRDLVGQEHVTTTLANSLTAGHISHAYLFSGPRGTGKTSAAKLFAKAVNCVHGPAAEPCNECEICQAITKGSLLDVIEIDAASNRGVDEIRDLRDKVKYAPTEVRYKVYIIDEVHMLTTEAFNALLKTLEEPPAHVVFILATTEPHKLPPTIISRCQRFPFRRIALQQMVGRLQYVAEQEGFAADYAALEQIARVADGGLRDALSLLDQAISFSDGKLTEETVLAIIGGVSEHVLLEILDHLHKRDRQAVLLQLDELFAYGIEVEQVVKDLLMLTRDMVLAKTQVGRASISEAVKRSVDTYPLEQLVTWIDQLVLIQQQLKWVDQPNVLLELFFIRQTSDLSPQVQQVVSAPTTTSPTATSSQPAVKPVADTDKKPEQKPVKKVQPSNNSPTQTASGAIDPKVQQEWPIILQTIKQQRVTLHAWLADGEIVQTTPQTVTIAMKSSFHRETVMKPENKQIIEQHLQHALHHNYEIQAFTREEWEQQRGQVETSAASSSPTASADDIVEKAIAFFGEELVTVKK